MVIKTFFIQKKWKLNLNIFRFGENRCLKKLTLSIARLFFYDILHQLLKIKTRVIEKKIVFKQINIT